MPILHKFHQTNWNNRFQTHNAILDVTPYEPEVIFIGSFNHGWPWNTADFFYGRGMYMWTTLANLFLYNANILAQRRTPPPGNNNPTLNQIFEVCMKGRITFADIVLGTKVNVPTKINLGDKSVLVNNQYLWKSYKDSSLDFMGRNQWLYDNVENIITYINLTPTIKHIYFTFKSGTWLVNKMNLIIGGTAPIPSCSIFTPTGSGFGNNLPVPFNNRAWSLAHCWVWNTLAGAVLINKMGYCHLNHQWLISHGVNPNNF